MVRSPVILPDGQLILILGRNPKSCSRQRGACRGHSGYVSCAWAADTACDRRACCALRFRARPPAWLRMTARRHAPELLVLFAVSLTQPGAFGYERSFKGRRFRNAWCSSVGSGRLARRPPIAPWPSHTSARGSGVSGSRARRHAGDCAWLTRPQITSAPIRPSWQGLTSPPGQVTAGEPARTPVSPSSGRPLPRHVHRAAARVHGIARCSCCPAARCWPA